MRQLRRILCVSTFAVGLVVLAAGTTPAGSPPKGDPADITIDVEPKVARPGDVAAVKLQLVPKAGFKITRYPKIRLQVPAKPGLVSGGEAAVGNAEPPPPDQMETNYFKTVEPVRVELKLDAAAPKGRHEIEGKLSYFYCVSASGFCAPAKAVVKIPLTVR